MADPRFDLSVALAPGTGLIGRREHTLLFIPDPDDRVKVLLDAFTHGPVDETWERLAEAVIDQDFDVCAFSCISATDQIEIRVFGDIELTTDLRSVPMLSGAASGTWVEHRVPGQPRSASVTTAGDEVDDRTALVDGIAHAGGFEARLNERRTKLTTASAGGDDAAISIPSSNPHLLPIEDTSIDDDSVLVAHMDRLARAAAAAIPSPANTAADELASGEAASENAPSENAPSENAPDALDVAEATDLADAPAMDADPTLDPEQATNLVDQVDDSDLGISAKSTTNPDDQATGFRPTIAARVCKSGHPNNPSRATCDVCDVFLPAGNEGVTMAPRPSLGTLVFDDERRIELTSDVMVGRNPSRSGDHWIPVIVEGERISRTHLTVRCSAWDVLIEDAGSHNGTVVLPSDGSQPVALVAGTPHLVEPGATAYFGSSSFRFEGRAAQ